MGLFRGDIISTLTSVVVLLFSISFHECSHGYIAYLLGDRTAKHSGRLTLNPLAHLDPIGTLMILGGLVGWAKPVPINPNNFNTNIPVRRGIVYTSVAGPISNLFLSFVANIIFNIYWLVSLLLSIGGIITNSAVNNVITLLLTKMILLNLYLAIFNLLPVPPLDGFKIFGAILPSKIYYTLMNYENYIGFAFIFIIYFASSTLSGILGFLATPFSYVLHYPVDALFRTLALALVG